jgi:four helix bundle protein
MGYRNLRLLEAAERSVDQINELIDRSSGRLLYVTQMRDSAQSIVANIAEGLGRGPGRDRARFLQIARGSAEETIRHLGANFRMRRIQPNEYWPIHHRLVVIVKMLNAFLR